MTNDRSRKLVLKKDTIRIVGNQEAKDVVGGRMVAAGASCTCKCKTITSTTCCK